METTRLSTKGQITVPKEIRDSHSWGAGTEFTVEETRDGLMLRPVNRFPKTKLEDVIGCLRTNRKAATLAEMDAGVTAMIKERHDRGRY